jgi:spermidine synthase
MMRSNPVEKPVVAEAETKVIDWSKYEPKTPEEAYQITRKAFRRVANGLNDGTEIASEGLGKMEEMGKVFN